MAEFQQTMPSGAEQPILGRIPLIMASGFALCCLTLAAIASITGLGVVRMPQSEIVSYRDIVIVDGADGRARIEDAIDKSVIVEMQAGQEGFVRMVLRGMAQQRTAAGGSREFPFRLAKHEDGHLILTDLQTGNRRVLDAFGAVNAASFQELMVKGK
jgi:putative photosynthetic complex assembly protein